MLALLDRISDGPPLVFGGVNAGRVVGACMQENDASFGHSLDVGNHAIEVQTNGVLVVVAVLLDLQARIIEDGLVVRPAGRGDVDGLRAGVEALQESTSNPKSTSSGDGLGDSDPVFLDRRRVRAVRQQGSRLGECGDTGNAGVLLIKV